jgi:hypothetical protein
VVTAGVGSCSTGEERGVRKLQGLVAQGGGHRGVVDGGGAWLESVLRRGFRWPKAAVRAWEAVGRVGHSRGGLERSGDGRTSGAASREEMARGQHDREGGKGRKGGGSGRGVPHGAGGAVGPGPDWRTAPDSCPSAALAGDVHARALSAETERGERRLTGGPAQCRVAVPLTGRYGLSAARESMGCGRADARGPVREEKEMDRPDAQ